MSGDVEWTNSFRDSKTKPSLLIDEDHGRYQIPVDESISHLLKKGDLLAFPILFKEFKDKQISEGKATLS